MILADIQPNPTAATTGEIVLYVAFFIGLLVNIVTIYALLSNRKERREVSWAFEPASKQEFVAHVAWDNREQEKIWQRINGVESDAIDRLDQKLTGMESAATEERRRLHVRIDEISKAVGRIEGKLDI